MGAFLLLYPLINKHKGKYLPKHIYENPSKVHSDFHTKIQNKLSFRRLFLFFTSSVIRLNNYNILFNKPQLCGSY